MAVDVQTIRLRHVLDPFVDRDLPEEVSLLEQRYEPGAADQGIDLGSAVNVRADALAGQASQQIEDTPAGADPPRVTG